MSEKVTIEPVTPGDRAAVAAFFAGHPWPFHSGGTPTPASVLQRIDAGWLSEPGTETYWLAVEQSRVGLLRLFDLDDGAPLFDLRIAPDHRGQGIGGEAVRRLTRDVFTDHPHVDRIEATTRVDNVAMRRALLRAGWVKESHWRCNWPDPSGRLHDGVGYAILRADYTSGTTTPVDWNA